ncbi:hypothetical protein [Kitasatospora sp. NPDC002040]|uniref:hypothetical protein n=1 Tax=Kitasatospora sp. NPDC002040 TaxID=3154661 RepID=UPI0033201D73
MSSEHAWLELDGLIMDITADQFDDAPGERAWVTRDRQWHDTFEATVRNPRMYRSEDDDRLDAYPTLRTLADGG